MRDAFLRRAGLGQHEAEVLLGGRGRQPPAFGGEQADRVLELGRIVFGQPAGVREGGLQHRDAGVVPGEFAGGRYGLLGARRVAGPLGDRHQPGEAVGVPDRREENMAAKLGEDTGECVQRRSGTPASVGKPGSRPGSFRLDRANPWPGAHAADRGRGGRQIALPDRRLGQDAEREHQALVEVEVFGHRRCGPRFGPRVVEMALVEQEARAQALAPVDDVGETAGLGGVQRVLHRGQGPGWRLQDHQAGRHVVGVGGEVRPGGVLGRLVEPHARAPGRLEEVPADQGVSLPEHEHGRGLDFARLAPPRQPDGLRKPRVRRFRVPGGHVLDLLQGDEVRADTGRDGGIADHIRGQRVGVRAGPAGHPRQPDTQPDRRLNARRRVMIGQVALAQVQRLLQPARPAERTHRRGDHLGAARVIRPDELEHPQGQVGGGPAR